MEKALLQARRGMKKEEVPIGAIVVKDDEIIGRGYNTRISKKDPLGHAEIMAIDRARRKIKDFRLVDCEIYITVEPCILCLGAILQSRIKRVVYGCKNGQEGATSLMSAIRRKLKMNYKTEICGPFMERESMSLMRAFFKKLRS